MGQRTQIIIQTVSKDGVKANRAYHLQWGFGRIMPLRLMNLFLNDYFKETLDKEYNIANAAKLKDKHKLCDITNEVDFPADFDVTKIKQVKEIFNHFDNNNGGMVIRVTENDPIYHGWNYLVGFVLGYEGCWDYDKEIEIEKPFSRFVSWKEYFEKEGEEFCKDKGFLQMWKGFIRFANIKFIKPTKTNKKNV